jgi:hypothetical protein
MHERKSPGAAGTTHRADSPYAKDCKTSVGRPQQARRIDFHKINNAARPHLYDLVSAWLPTGRVEGPEFVALNPKRCDRHHGSFRINIVSGNWADFAVTGASGGDIVSLLAYLRDCRQSEAAREIARILGVAP